MHKKAIDQSESAVLNICNKNYDKNEEIKYIISKWYRTDHHIDNTLYISALILNKMPDLFYYILNRAFIDLINVNTDKLKNEKIEILGQIFALLVNRSMPSFIKEKIFLLVYCHN